MRQNILVVFGFFLALNISCSAQKGTTAKPAKPNILVVIVDDYGWRDIHAYGSDFYETPNMDKLIGQGMKFTQAYSSYPRCVPSRYSVMTGTNPARIKGDDANESGYNITSPNISIGQAMKNTGYSTFYVGKWHLGAEEFAPAHVGFDRSVAAGAAGATSSHFAPYNVGRNGKAPSEAPIPDVENAPQGECLEDRLTDETIQLIRTRGNEPFFGILAQYAVHTPIQGKEEYVKYFQEKLKRNPPPQGPDYENVGAGENKLKQDNPKYAAMIKAVDDGVGKIMMALEEEGIAENTIIILTSDHGGLSARGNQRELATTNRPLRGGKGHLYEGGIRVPLFVKWPGVVKPGSETNSMIIAADHFSTILEMAGGKVPTGQLNDGTSYVNILKGGKANTTRTLFWHNPAPRPTQTADIYSSAIRVGDYKLIDFFGLGKQELYNLKDDIGENNDISAQNPELVKKLFAEMEAWRKKTGALMKLKPGSMSDAEKAVKNASDKPLTPEQMQKKEQRKQERKAEKNNSGEPIDN